MDHTNFRNLNRGYMKLDVWRKGIELYEAICETTKQTRMDLRLKSQPLDAALSVPSNIAEGFSRRSIKEYIQYLYVSLGSLSETMTRLIGSRVAGEISEEAFRRIDNLHYETENKTLRLVQSLKTKKRQGSWSDELPR